VRTVQRWEKDFGLPVRRPSGHLRGSVFAVREDIDRWLNTRQAREAAASATTVNKPTRNDADRERLHKNAQILMERCNVLRAGAEMLEENIRRTEILRAKLRGREVPAQVAVA